MLPENQFSFAFDNLWMLANVKSQSESHSSSSVHACLSVFPETLVKLFQQLFYCRGVARCGAEQLPKCYKASLHERKGYFEVEETLGLMRKYTSFYLVHSL